MSHAVADFVREHGHTQQVKDWQTNSNVLVALGVANEEELIRWQQRLSPQEPRSLFREPDRQNEATALAALPSPEGSKKVFAGLKLLS